METPAKIVVANRRGGGIWFWLLRLYGFGALVVVAIIGLLLLRLFAQIADSAPAVPDLSDYALAARTVTTLTAHDGTSIGEFAEEWRDVVPYESIPPQLIDAFLAAEDHRYFEHNGIDFRGTLRALWRNVARGDFAQGGSTITQQVAKQFIGSEKSLLRKANEAVVARRLEAVYSKKAILAVYLNHIFLGGGAHGVKAAAERYFGKPLAELDLGEMALIAGLAKAPTRFSPFTSLERAQRRRDEVLDRMRRFGFIEASVATATMATPLLVNPSRARVGDMSPYYVAHVVKLLRTKLGDDALASGGMTIETALDPVADALAIENVRYGARRQDKRQGWRGPITNVSGTGRQLFVARAKALYDDRPLSASRRYYALVTAVQSSGADVTIGSRSYRLPIRNMKWAHRWSATDSTNDLRIGNARRALSEGDIVLVSIEKPEFGKFRQWDSWGRATPKWIPAASESRRKRELEQAEGMVVLEQVEHPQVSIFSADLETGYVVANVGGTDYERSQLNRNTQSCRQPGSTYKPIYYSAALDAGYGFDTTLNDIPRAEVDPITGEVWRPTNLGGTVDTRVSLEYAMVYSKNVPSVAIFKKVGAEQVVKWARRLGSTTEIIADRALALGASCTMLDELTRAFAIFGRNGRWVDFVHVRRAFDRRGKLLVDNTVVFDAALPASDRLDRLAAVAGRQARQAIPARTAFLTTKLLRRTIKSGFSAVVRATGINAAGKTGTSSATMDTSFVGYTSRWITAVWMGDDDRVRPLGTDDAAYITVVPIWARYMAEAALGHPNAELPSVVPDGVDPDDRGDHSKGSRKRMPLYYKGGHGGVQ